MITIVLFICFLLAVGYSILILLYCIGWLRQKDFRLPENYTPATTVSVIIAARNESDNIEACLLSILRQNYPATLFDVTVVDDFSQDDTVEKVKRLSVQFSNLHLLQLKGFVADRSLVKSFKKKALGVAIENTKGGLIITTDADCVANQDWIGHIVARQEQTNAQMIVAPVDFTCNGNLVELFQSLDFMTMQGITAAANQLKLGNMANGANLAFTRKAYDAVNGYEGIDHLASGDDYLLMVKIQDRFPNTIQYLKSRAAIIRTAPQPDWPAFLQQRVRWASKSGKYKDTKLTTILLVVYLFNLSLFLLMIAGIFNFSLLKAFLCILSFKYLLEMIFLWPVAQFFNKRKQLIFFLFLQPFHIIYISLAGFLGWKGSFVWKGRTIK